MKIKKISLIILGCPKNEVDAEVLAGELRKNGFILVDDVSLSDAIIIFTCAFITDAVKEAIDVILEITSFHQFVIVTGCLPSRYNIDTLKSLLPEVKEFFDTYNYINIPFYLKSKNYKPINKFLYNSRNNRFLENRNFAYVKIAEGCNNRCSFCTIPLIKGKLFSRTVDDIIEEVKTILDLGVREIILVSQNNGQYGIDLKYNSGIVKLIKELLKLNQIEWLRVLYIYPDDINEEFLELTEDEKFCKYLDIPIQHIDDNILKLMNRKTSEKRIREILDKIKKEYPNIFLRTSLIVGFPGEDDGKFVKLLNFIKEYEFYNLGCFVYSNEEGTKSYSFNQQINAKIKVKRYKKIMSEQKKIVTKINKTLVNNSFKVNISGYYEETKLLLKGRTEFQSPDIDGITLINKGEIENPGFYKVRITDFKDYDLIGEIV